MSESQEESKTGVFANFALSRVSGLRMTAYDNYQAIEKFARTK